MSTATCYFCEQAIRPGDAINLHHPVYKSNGGSRTEPAHRHCHVEHHKPDFKEWGRIGGKISALSRRWSLNLRNVRTDPAHEINRAFYWAMYGR